MTDSEFWALLVEAFPGLASHQKTARLARGETYLQKGEWLQPDDEIAVIPPVSSCNCRTRSKCSMRSANVSICPNIIVAEDQVGLKSLVDRCQPALKGVRARAAAVGHQPLGEMIVQ